MPTSRPTKQTQRAVAVVDQARLQQLTTRPSRLVQMVEQAGKPTPLQRKIAMETVTRAGSIEASNLLHEWASQHISHAHVTSQRNVYQTVSHLNAVMTMPMDEVTAADMTAWTTAQKQMFIRHEATLLDATVGNITRIAMTPLPQEEEEQPKGLLGWLIGRR